MNSIVFVYKWNRYQAPRASFRAFIGGLIYKMPGGLILTDAAADYKARREATWIKHSMMIQSLLDEERAKGYGLSVLTGKRVDF